MRASPDRVVIRNARQHNLKGITVELPRRALSVITGPSGSGKSSLAFDTLYAEGQRRYIESLSTYAKQFLDRMPKPLVDAIEGISPAVAIEQKNPTTSSRSTVGTATEIYDFLRLLWARVGIPHCVNCGQVVKVDTVQEVVDELMVEVGTRKSELEGSATSSAFRVPRSALVIAFPLPASAHRPDVELAAQLRAAGFVRAQLDGTVTRLDEPDAARRVRAAEEVLEVVDRLPSSQENRGRHAQERGPGRPRPARRSALRRPRPHPAADRASTRPTVRGGLPRPPGAGPALVPAGRERWLPRDVPVPHTPGGEAVQAVHPRLPAAISARQDVPCLRGRASQARGARRARRWEEHRGGRRPDGGRPARLGRAARAAVLRPDDRRPHPGRALGAAFVRERRRARLSDARPPDAHVVRRRGAAHCALECPRVAPGGHAVRAG